LSVSISKIDKKQIDYKDDRVKKIKYRRI
jgi:hypothetical protein